MASTVVCFAALGGCIGIKSGGEGVFEPTAIQLPPSERGAGDKPVAPAERSAERAADRRGLAIPNR